MSTSFWHPRTDSRRIMLMEKWVFFKITDKNTYWKRMLLSSVLSSLKGYFQLILREILDGIFVKKMLTNFFFPYLSSFVVVFLPSLFIFVIELTSETPIICDWNIYLYALLLCPINKASFHERNQSFLHFSCLSAAKASFQFACVTALSVAQHPSAAHFLAWQIKKLINV